MKKRIILPVLAIVLAGSLYYLSLMLPIITGYAAKNLASGIFIAGRTQGAMEWEDLNFSVIKFTKNTVDLEEKKVTSRFFWEKSTAVYVEGFGCTLVKDYTEEEIKARNYPSVNILPKYPERISWPAGDLIADTVPQGINLSKLEMTLMEAMSDTIPSKGTFAVMVVYKGHPVAEVYRDDFGRNNRFLSWSMAKSFTNTLIGLMVKDQLVDIHKPIELLAWQVDGRKEISLNHLMQMNSGLKWNEGYGNLSDVTNMLHKVGDMGKYTAMKKSIGSVDSIFNYSSGSTNLASMVLRNSFSSDQEYLAYPRKALFNKIGMRSAIFELDASGTFVGSSYLYATMRDYARFGLLYLNDGKWKGQQVLPEGWVDYSIASAKGSKGQYGAFFWLNGTADLLDAPEDTYLCRGHDGQFIVIIPSKELVIVRTGFSKHGEFDLNRMVKGILESVE